MREDGFDLPGYLEERFPELAFPEIAWKAGGVFYNWPRTIRFELSQANARSRAVALYEAIFLPSDACVVAGLRFIFADGSKERADDLFTFSARHDTGLNQKFQRKEWWTETGPSGGDKGTLALEWVVQPARSFNYARIIQGIANSERDLEPRLNARAYFLAPEKGVLFHMYDDRGLDIAAVEPSTLIPLYKGFTGWILDHDRSRIDRTFGTIPFRKGPSDSR
jgi:hypothetical protein